MIKYKYSLENGSKKFICPNCKKKTFVRYIDNEIGDYLLGEFGRCDRETNCGYHNKPKLEVYTKINIPEIKKKIVNYHNMILVKECIRKFNQNNFIKFLETIFNDSQVKNAVLRYLIGTSKRWDGATIFWQIDNFKNVHAGKIIQYNSNSGKRIKTKTGKVLIDWVHSILIKKMILKDYKLAQCLFGLHLINEVTNNTIAIVESEKTAVIMSVFKPEYIWLATGSKGGFKYDLLKPIKNYKIIAFPDKSEYEYWLETAKKLNSIGFNIIVNEWLENQNEFESGTDLADVYLYEKNKHYEIDYSEK